MISCVSSSYEDPRAISKKRLNSLSLVLADPSAIFEGIDIADLFICDTKENFSISGKDFVVLRTSVDSFNPFFQIFNSLKLCISNSQSFVFCLCSFIFGLVPQNFPFSNNRLNSFQCFLLCAQVKECFSFQIQ